MASGHVARIAYVDHALEIGGAEKSMLDIIERLDRSRYAPTVLCTEGAEWLNGARPPDLDVVPAFSAGGVLTTTRTQVAQRGLDRRFAAGAMRQMASLYRTFRRLRPDIVHTNTVKAHMLGGPAAHLARRRAIWHLRDILDEGRARSWLTQTAGICRPLVIAISEAVRESLRGVDVDIRMIHNGTDLRAFYRRPDRERLRRELGLSPEDVAICVVGRLTPWKGHRTLLRAFAETVKEVPAARLVVAGEVAFWNDAYDAELKGLARSLGIESVVSWLGFRDDVPEILSACDVFALPSVDEPFGRVFVEAMACELPAVGTRTGGVPEIVLDGATGLLVAPEDPEDLARALVTLCRSSALRERMGARGRERALDRFDADRTAERVQAVYEELLARG